ncbi:MAG: GWxTD domain-containing protein, partial [Thermodesulfobacteriota bacterium]
LCYFKDEFTRGSEFLEELIDQTQDSLKAFVFLAWCQAGNKEYDQAFKSFVRVFEFLGDDEKSLYTEPIYLISKSESKRYSHLPAEERRRFWQSYWKMRDPEPLTDVNERLVEHYVRVSYSRTYFSQKQYPWDRRGEIFVRYGEPDYRSFTGGIEKIYDTDTQARVETGAIWRASDYKKSLDKYGLTSIPFENWIYFDLWGGKPAELVFSDNTLSGKYDYPFPSKRTSPTSVTYSPAMVAEEIIAETPETFHYDYGGEPLDFPFDLADFRGKGGQSAVEVYYGVLISQLEVSEETEKAWVETGIALFDQDWHVVSKMSEETVIPLPPATDRSEGSLAVNLLRLSVPAGEYHLAIQIKDEVSGKIGIYKRDISIEDYTPKSLTLSDIQLAGSVAPSLKEGRFTKRGLSVIPFPTKRYRQSQLVYIYYEIYNLSKDKYGRTHFQTDYTVASLLGEKNVVSQIVSGLGSLIGVDRKKGEITVSYEDRGTSGTEIGYTSIDIRDSPPGEYQLMVAVEDLNRGEKVKKSIVFTLLE